MTDQGLAQRVTQNEVTPDGIIQLGLSFWASKTLLSAVELGLFTELATNGPQDCETLRKRLGLHSRSAEDFCDALVALGMLNRHDRKYQNTPASAQYLDRTQASYAGGFLEMSGARLYRFWGDLTEALKTGEPQNEAKHGGDLFSELYNDPHRLKGFLQAMSAISAGSTRAIVQKFPWSRFRSMIDLGAAQGAVPVAVAAAHPHVTTGGLDLPPVQPHFEAYAAEHDLADRVRFYAGDFFVDPLPPAEVYVIGRVLHDWDIEKRRMLIQKAFDALPSDGALLVYETIIDDERQHNAFGLLMSLNMLIETRGGGDYTAADCKDWMRAAGFGETWSEHLVGPDSMVVGIKA